MRFFFSDLRIIRPFARYENRQRTTDSCDLLSRISGYLIWKPGESKPTTIIVYFYLGFVFCWTNNRAQRAVIYCGYGYSLVFDILCADYRECREEDVNFTRTTLGSNVGCRIVSLLWKKKTSSHLSAAWNDILFVTRGWKAYVINYFKLFRF